MFRYTATETDFYVFKNNTVKGIFYKEQTSHLNISALLLKYVSVAASTSMDVTQR